jgi:hypothetical protein
MKLFNIRGRLVNKNVVRFLIKWDAPSRSKLQASVKSFLKPYWLSDSVYEEFPVYGSLLKVDFLNATRKIAIEVQGDQHGEFSEFFHKTRMNYWKSIKRDSQKATWLEKNGFKLIEINSDEVNQLSRDFFIKHFNVVVV